MKYPSDRTTSGPWTGYAVLVLPLAYLLAALLYSASLAPWGRQVDPEAVYAMNGLAWAAGYPMMKSDHPGTTTILLAGLVIKLWTFFARPADVVEFGLKNFDLIIYASRAAEAVILSAALLAGGIIVRNATRSAVAAMLFQVGPFAGFETLHYEIMLMPESLMASCAIFGMALALKAALDERPPTIGLGAAAGLTFGLGLSSKFLHLPLAVLGLSLFRNRWAFGIAILSGSLSFFIFNRLFNPNVFTGGFHWLFNLATHKGNYGEGDAGFIDFTVFWRNMGEVIAAAPIVFTVFVSAALLAPGRMQKSGRYLDPISLTLIASFFAYFAQLVATSKHFAPHYMLASRVLTGGVLVLAVVEARRLFPRLSPLPITAAAATMAAVLIASALVQTTSAARQWIALDRTGARLSNAIVAAGPSCANVSGMLVRAPENELHFAADTSLGVKEAADRFADTYGRLFKAPLLDYNFYNGRLSRNFRPFSYKELTSEYPCIVVRSAMELDPKISGWLLELRPDHCSLAGIQVYTVGIPCETIRRAAQSE